MISERYARELIKRWAGSPEGKAEIKRQTGLTYADNDPSAELAKYGEQMKAVLYKHVSALIKSIELADIIVQTPYQDDDGVWKLEIFFREGSLKRESLYYDEYPNGLKNIVLLFAKGYKARDHVYGLWNTTGSVGTHYIYWKDTMSRRERDGSDFLIQAVDEFNAEYGKDIARAELIGDYKDCSNN